MLENIDVLIFDIQDIGARFYTYIQTMALAMEAAAEQGVTFVVFDRPNPINGEAIEGNLVEPDFTSFVGLFPIPVRHGMTVAELAGMINNEGWLKNGVRAELKVIPLENWNRNMWFDETGQTFVKPSPNMPDLETAAVYPGLCLLEGTNISEGRGTQTPFLTFGAPWIDADTLCHILNRIDLYGLQFNPITFTPESIPGMAGNPKYRSRECHGAEIIIENRSVLHAYWTGIRITDTIHRLYPDSFDWRIGHFDRLCGSDLIRKTIDRQSGLDSLQMFIEKHEAGFRERRQTYLLYF
jgi:beta-N-acetylhexosaminidase